MQVNTLLRHATQEEREAIRAAAQRAYEHPAIIVTIRHEGQRRYVVDQEDEHLFEALARLKAAEIKAAVANRLGGFGAQWVRRYGNVDEMHRTLAISEVTNVTSTERHRVWGT
jgi:hypothetical protein